LQELWKGIEGGMTSILDEKYAYLADDIYVGHSSHISKDRKIEYDEGICFISMG